MSAKVGVALIAGGAGTLYYGASLPGEPRKFAFAVGAAAIIAGGLMVWTAVDDAGGLLAAFGGSIFDTREGQQGETLLEEQDLKQVADGTTAPAPNVPGRKFAIPYTCEFRTPREGSSVRVWNWLSGYTMTVDVQNNTDRDWTGTPTVVADYTFAISADVRVQGSGNRQTIPAGQHAEMSIFVPDTIAPFDAEYHAHAVVYLDAIAIGQVDFTVT